MLLQDRIDQNEALGVLSSYDKRQLERLEDMEMFLQMSWDVWMGGLETKQTVAEESK